MDIQTLLAQAPERLRAYWAGEADPGRVGWRAEPTFCPVAEWLDYEQDRAGVQIAHLPTVRSGEIIFCGKRIATPPVLMCFIDLVDAATMAADAWLAGTDRIEREEALAALAEAERRTAQRRLLAPCCAFPECGKRVVTPQLHGFLRAEPNEPIVRSACWPFAGGLCEQHIAHLIVPPADWWPKEFKEIARELQARYAEKELVEV